MPSAYIPVDKQRAVIERAEGRCEYCQSMADYATEKFAVEHVMPVSRGGTSELDNLALSCSGCNGHKYNKTEALDPADGKLVPLFNPRQQLWQTHFSWSDDFTRIIGLTAIGRATVEALQMNRPGLVNMRRLLYLIRQHPPKLNDT
ncbi:MAG: HNH endonuclease [candidate division KSB1 bacterium]|nr:HNH endonuclease [candidate division KSB1 bacterium]MDZ7369407.1 HNH endonuclease [candidate division KSB1 bacterium]